MCVDWGEAGWGQPRAILLLSGVPFTFHGYGRRYETGFLRYLYYCPSRHSSRHSAGIIVQYLPAFFEAAVRECRHDKQRLTVVVTDCGEWIMHDDLTLEFCVVERLEVSARGDEDNVNYFKTEREARRFFNRFVNGFNVFELWSQVNAPVGTPPIDDVLIVASRCPILMIA